LPAVDASLFSHLLRWLGQLWGDEFVRQSRDREEAVEMARRRWGLDKSCKKCIYLVEALGKHKPVLICTNRDGARGQLYCSDPPSAGSPCRNYRTNPVIDRPAVVQPKDSQIRLIPLTKGKIAIVDAADYDWLNSHKWSVNQRTRGVYACCQIKGEKIYMHRLITNPPAGKVVDHIDRNGLNNRRSNLRICSIADNSRNLGLRGGTKTSLYKGVSWNRKSKKWMATIKFNQKYHHIGFFDNQIAAAKAYDKTARKLFKEFAYLNFPDDKATLQ
jgi:hypothetical protein